MRWVVSAPFVAALLLAAACSSGTSSTQQPSRTAGQTPSAGGGEGIQISFDEPHCEGVASNAAFEVLSPDADLVSASFTVDYPFESSQELPPGERDTGVFVVGIDGAGTTTLTVKAANAGGQSAEETKTFKC